MSTSVSGMYSASASLDSCWLSCSPKTFIEQPSGSTTARSTESRSACLLYTSAGRRAVGIGVSTEEGVDVVKTGAEMKLQKLLSWT